MVMAGRPAAGGAVQFRALVRAEPWTVTARGYPQLLQVAEPYRGGILTDRQHPPGLQTVLSVACGSPVWLQVVGSLFSGPVESQDLGPSGVRPTPMVRSTGSACWCCTHGVHGPPRSCTAAISPQARGIR